MEEAIPLLVQELEHLKRTGTQGVYVSDPVWSALQEAAARPQPCEPAPVVPHTPEPHIEELVTVRDEPPEATHMEPKFSLPAPESFSLPDGDKQTQWDWLRDRVLNCPVCNAHVKPGKKVVFGVGSLNADIFFCGEAPGGDEEIQGEPFVGKAGQLLTKIIQAMGLQRSTVYIGNIMNWRPEMPTSVGNRPPTQEEMNYCLPFLKAQVNIVRPKVIVALGATAVSGLLGPDNKRRMSSIRGQWQRFENTHLMVTFHPSYLLRNSTLQTKRMVWEDMLKVMEFLKMPISAKQQAYFTQASAC